MPRAPARSLTMFALLVLTPLAVAYAQSTTATSSLRACEKAGATLPSCASRTSAQSPSTSGADGITTLDSLYRAHDYFTLRSRISSGDTNLASTGFYLAAVQQAFNDLLRSNATIRRTLRAAGISDSLRFALGRMQLSNDLRLSMYHDADSVTQTLLANPPASVDSATLSDIRNTGRLAHVLRNVSPQVAKITGPSVVHTDSSHRIAVQIGDSLRYYGFDTGANLSVLMRSEAAALGLRIRPAALTVGSSTDVTVKTDVAVAPRLTIGRIAYQNVVFLVFPDRALTFSDGYRIPGLIGFPVIEAMGEIHFRKDGTLEIPSRASPHTARSNLALEELRMFVQIGYDTQQLACQLDTGAGRTVFLAPYYESHRASFDALGGPDSIKTGGAGGVRTLPVYRLQHVKLTVGDTSDVLDSVPVHTTFLQSHKDEPACRIGLDALRRFNEYVINFRSMTLELR